MNKPLISLNALRCSGLTAAGLCCSIVIAGCGKAPEQPATTTPNASSSNASDAPVETKPTPTADSQPAASGASSSPASGAASSAASTAAQATPEVASNSEVAAEPQPQSGKSSPASNQNASPAKATAPTIVPAPVASPEQVAKWSLPKTAPLELIACYDNFGDSLVQSASIAPDGKQMVVGGIRLTLWSWDSDKPKVDLLEKQKVQEGERPVRCVSYSPDGKWIAAGDQKGNLRLFSAEDTSKLQTVQGHPSRLVGLAFSPDSKKLATTSYSGEIRVWQVPELKPLKAFKASDREVPEFVFLTNDLLVVGGPKTAMWDVNSGEQTKLLLGDYVTDPGLAVSPDRKQIAVGIPDGTIKFWDVQKEAFTQTPRITGRGQTYSPDGKLLASMTNELVQIWELETSQLIQAIDSPFGQPEQLAWLPTSQTGGAPVLMVASQNGRIRLWGNRDGAAALKCPPVEQPALENPSGDDVKPYSSAQFAKIIDLRSFPCMPGAIQQWQQYAMVGYQTTSPREEVELFYRVNLAKAGWQERKIDQPGATWLEFGKAGCLLMLSISPGFADPSQPQPAADKPLLQINLNLVPNIDVRKLPKFQQKESGVTYVSQSSTGYVTAADITDLEVAIIKQFHALGWTPYARLDAAGLEEPDSRRISFLQRGCELMVSIGHPADAKDLWMVQTNVSVLNKSLPIPPDSGWVEFDASTEIKMVANTKMTLPETIQFYDTAMKADGWAARPGRMMKEEAASLPFLRDGQDVLIHILKTQQGTSMILVGEVLRSSWQLAKPEAKPAPGTQPGIEAADYKLPPGAKNLKFDLDEKNIEFTLEGVLPTALGEQFITQMNGLGWKQDGAGIKGDDYTFITFEKDKVDISLRARSDNGKGTSAMIGGDGLLWNKPLPTAPVRVSYETWMRRARRPTSLAWLDEYQDEMKKIKQ